MLKVFIWDIVKRLKWLYYHTIRGGLAEWSKAVVLKTIDLHGSAGSNPVSSAIIFGEVGEWPNPAPC